jgi:cytoskeletal protein RodZ
VKKVTGLGTLLQEAREEQGLSIEDLAEQTNIRPHFLRAMEAGDLAELPGEAYVRPFFRTYARALGLDGEQILLEFDARSLPSSAELANIHKHREKIRAKKRRRFGFRLLVLVMVLAGIGYALYKLILA